MSIAGSWDITLNTPMGKQKGKMTANLNDGALEGEILSPLGAIVMEDGKADGDQASWNCKVTTPIAMTLEFAVEVEGDNFNGTVKVGPMGKNSVEGVRCA
ncbi:hypothetical protein [Spongiibacter tropicus]|uniref:hypothetical protein n=1 Tax=Spongiibacter tropicus TaxID=454602 RepID=UPI0003B35C6B|nr:hypothetical protein [Spongiibacter tropicus]